jgi:hypothetical protein
MLVFILQSQIVTSFNKFNSFLSISTDFDTEHEFVLFLWVGKSQNRPQRRYLGLALLALWQA